jgi:hypothetical protein
MPSTTQRLAAFAAVLATPLFPSSASWGWFWQKENTVRAYEKCVRENRSAIVEVTTIEKKCAEKLAGPIPAQKLEVDYGEVDEVEHDTPVWGQKRIISKHYVAHFSVPGDFLLTSVSALVEIEGRPAQSVTTQADIPTASLSLDALPVGHGPTRYENPPSYVKCSASKTSNCINIRVISANGFEVAIE